jgi:hypothetical protein
MFPLIRWVRKALGHDKDSAETFDRLIWSKHVEDLRWIVNVTALATIFVICLIIGMAITLGTHSSTPATQASMPAAQTPTAATRTPTAEKLYDALVPFHVSAVLAAFGGIIAWCYQTGSGRLGIVDLFACEITTLCRICTINGLASTCVGAFELDTGKMEGNFGPFESSETYTPVFNANAKELQVLSVKVVTNITSFYTYWKATRDAFRKLSSTSMPTDVTTPSAELELWRAAMRNVIYMQFLTFESARKVVRGLIEYEPSKTENTIVILLSELPLYEVLLKDFAKNKEDVRYQRLAARLTSYPSIVAGVYYQTKEKYSKYECIISKQLAHPIPADLGELHKDWNKAHRMLSELKSRYVKAIDELPPE